MKKIKIIWAVVPKMLVFLLGVYLFFYFTANGNKVVEIYSIAFRNLFFFFLFLYIGMIFHEIGHLLFAKLFGGVPKRIILGYGHDVTTLKILGIEIYIKKMIHRGGQAFAAFSKDKKNNTQRFFYYAGGVIVNLFFAVTFFLFFGFESGFLFSSKTSAISESIIISNALLFILNIIPYNTNSQGIKVANDGLRILNLFTKKAEWESNIELELFDATELVKAGKYNEAIELLEKLLEIEPKNLLIKYNLGSVYLLILNYNKSLFYLKQVEIEIENGKKFYYEVALYVNIAWVLYLQGQTETALDYSHKAYVLGSGDYFVKLIRGGLLIETGKIDLGISILEELIDFKFTQFTFHASIFLVLAYFLKNDEKKYLKYKKYLSNLKLKLSDFDQVFLDKINKKLTENTEVVELEI